MNSEININQMLAILNNSREALSLLNDKFELIYRTKTGEEMTGWNAEERKQNSGLNKTHPDDLELIQNIRAQVLQNPGKPLTAIFRTLHKNGKYIWMQMVMTNLLHDKNVRGIICNFENITDKKAHAEEQMLYDSIVNSSDDVILSWNLDLIITSWNKSAEKEFGYTADEIIGKQVFILIPPDLRNEELDIFKKIKRGQTVANFETKRITKSGKMIDVSLTVSPLKDYSGDIVGASKISRNITERKKSEEALKKYVREISDYKYALDESSIVAITDDKGIITHVNDNFCISSKFSREELIGKNHKMVSSGYHSKAFMKELWDTITNGQVWKGEIKNKAKDGTCYWVATTIVPFVNEQGKAVQYLAIRTDITERKNAEEKLTYVNWMYAFISQINQMIVHSQHESEVYEKACNIAVKVGKFKTAWIGMLDNETKVINLIAQSGFHPDDLKNFYNVPYTNKGILFHVLQNDASYICNDLQGELQLNNWRTFAKQKGYGSAMVLPIRKNGLIIGTFNLYAAEVGFFNETEIALLEEAVGDISFALDVFEKEKQHQIAEEKVRKTVKSLNQAQKISHLGSWEIDLKTGVALLSEELLNIYGLRPEEKEQTYQSWFSFVHPEDLQYVTNLLKEAEIAFSNSDFIYRIIRKDGAIRQIHVQAEFNLDAENNPIGLSGVAHDITEKKDAEKKLLESETFNKGVLSSLSAHIAVINQTGTILAVNKAWKDFAINNGSVCLERTSEGSNYFEVCEKAMAEGNMFASDVLNGLKLVFERKLPLFELEYPCHSPSKKRWFAVTAMNFGEDQNKIVISHQEVTERKEMELVLVRSQASTKAIIENTDAYIYALDRNLNYTAYNQRIQIDLNLCYGTDIKPGDSINKFLDKIGAEEAKEWKQIYKRALNGEMLKFEKEFIINDVKNFIGFSIHPIWENKYVVGLSCFALDITKQKNAEQKIIDSEKHIRNFANHLNQMQEEERAHLAREIHDELGQQLIGIKIGISTLTNKNAEGIKDLLKDVDYLIQSVRKIATELRPGILDSLGLIPSIEWLVKAFEKRTAIKCNLFLNVNEQWFEKDLSTCFFRISQEALTNITKHANATEIIFEMNYIDDVLTMEITDNGKGMTTEKLENPFSVGLLGMRERARNVGGDLQITSKQTEGTNVTLSVKIKPL